MNRKRNHLCASLALTLAILGLGVSAQAQKAPRRIIFARGATIARASGYLRGVRDEAWFVIRAGAGQHMRVDVRGRGPTRGVLYFPSGKQDGGPGGVIYDGEIDESGDYRIRVTESSMANAWRGSFTVTVEILPRGQPTPGASALESHVGKYPSEMFRKVPSLKTRLRSLLGTNYRAFFDRLQVEMPITRDGNALVARGCKAHQCTIEEAILVVDLLDGQPYVAIKLGSTFRVFADAVAHSDALHRAMQQ